MRGTITLEVSAQTVNDCIDSLKQILKFLEESKKTKVIKPVFNVPDEDIEGLEHDESF
jgi:hypothetical protein